MKVCQKCEKENPSSANFCLSCGKSLTTNTDNKESNANEFKKLKIYDDPIYEESVNQINTLKSLSDSLKNELEELKVNQKKEIIAKDEQLKELIKKSIENKRVSNGNWGWIFVILFVASLLLVYNFYSKYQENQNIISELNIDKEKRKNDNLNVERIQSDLMDSLQNENISIADELSLLKLTQPQLYKINVMQAFSYNRMCGTFYPTDCYYNFDDLINIYTVKDGYGLTLGGWLLLSDIELVEEENIDY